MYPLVLSLSLSRSRHPLLSPGTGRRCNNSLAADELRSHRLTSQIIFLRPQLGGQTRKEVTQCRQLQRLPVYCSENVYNQLTTLLIVEFHRMSAATSTSSHIDRQAAD